MFYLEVHVCSSLVTIKAVSHFSPRWLVMLYVDRAYAAVIVQDDDAV